MSAHDQESTACSRYSCVGLLPVVGCVHGNAANLIEPYNADVHLLSLLLHMYTERAKAAPLSPVKGSSTDSNGVAATSSTSTAAAADSSESVQGMSDADIQAAAEEEVHVFNGCATVAQRSLPCDQSASFVQRSALRCCNPRS
jgi:hypothetical protein